MRTATELWDEAYGDRDDDEALDLTVVTDLVATELQAAPEGSTTMDVQTMVGIQHSYMDMMFDHISHVLLTLAAEVGALPKGVEQEMDAMQTFRQYAMTRSVYAAAEALDAPKSKLTVVTDTPDV